MSDLTPLLEKYIFEPENPENNFNLAVYYENIGQTAAAVSYYLRCAERTNIEVKQYICLLKSAICFERQGCRNFTVKGLYQHAVSIMPKRPEAYFLLSRFLERDKKYHEGYLIASLGYDVADECQTNPLGVDIEYPGFWGLLFEKAVCSWWTGLCDDSRSMFRELLDNHKLDDSHYNSVVSNLEFLSTKNKNLHEVYDSDKKEDPIQKFNWGSLSTEFKNIINQEIFEERSYEQHFAVNEGDVVVDVGANCGAFTYSILDKNPKHVFCLEPSLELVNVLTGNVRNHKNKVTIIDRAISDQTSDDVLTSTEGVFIYNHNLDTYKSIKFKEFVENYNVSKIDFLKTDCEGGEWDIFTEENRDYIRKNVKNIVGEFHICNIKDSVSKFKIFRDLYLTDVETLHVYERDGKEVTEKIFDENFIEDYDNWWSKACPDMGQLIVHVSYKDRDNPKLHYELSKTQKSITWVVDNFYENPDSIRKYALDQDYHIGGLGRGYIGNRTHEQFLFPGLKKRFEDIMDLKISKWEEHGMNGRFQYCWSGQPKVWHVDSQMWGGMIYLTPNAPFESGTSLFAHKKNRARSRFDEGWNESWGGPGYPHLDGTPFEPVDVLGNVYNRLVIFDASCIHSASEYFGTVKENCRLWQMFFFDTE